VLVLAVETATMRTGVAIGSVDGILASFHVAHKHRHAETLAPAIEFVCGQAGVGLQEIGCIAVDIGPGLFTGLRVGVATAKAIAHACHIPMVPVASLDALAFPARMAGRRIVTILDALQDQVFYAAYEGTVSGIERIEQYSVLDNDDAVDRVLAGNEDCLIVGDAIPRLAALQASARIHIGGADLRYPSAESLIHLAAPMAERGETHGQAELSVMYLREPYIHPKRRDGSTSPQAGPAGLPPVAR
jgi:tRNA threonylcarbamoyladenosine biosynthesis protein TsaB